MRIDQKIILFMVSFVFIGLLISVVFPKEEKRNSDALIRMGAGDDVSGLLMEEIAGELEGKQEIAPSLETDSFADC